MKIYVPNYYQAGGGDDRDVSTDLLEVYDDEGRVTVTADGADSIDVTWIQSCFVPTATSSHRVWNVELSMSMNVTNPMDPLVLTFDMPYPLPLAPHVPLVGYFTTALRPTSMNAGVYWTSSNDRDGNVILTLHPTPEILSEGLELLYLNITLSTLVSG